VPLFSCEDLVLFVRETSNEFVVVEEQRDRAVVMAQRRGESCNRKPGKGVYACASDSFVEYADLCLIGCRADGCLENGNVSSNRRGGQCRERNHQTGNVDSVKRGMEDHGGGDAREEEKRKNSLNQMRW
jgi:hypothetical protein